MSTRRASAAFVCALALAFIAPPARAQTAERIELPTIGHSTDCGPVVGQPHVMCRYIAPLHLSDALRYPVFLQQQGWTLAMPQTSNDALLEDEPLWFQRAVNDACTEFVSLRLVPPAPETQRGPAVFIDTSHPEVCSTERGTQ